MIVPSYGTVIAGVSGAFLPSYGPVLYDGLGAPVCVPGFGMVIV